MARKSGRTIFDDFCSLRARSVCLFSSEVLDIVLIFWHTTFSFITFFLSHSIIAVLFDFSHLFVLLVQFPDSPAMAFPERLPAIRISNRSINFFKVKGLNSCKSRGSLVLSPSPIQCCLDCIPYLRSFICAVLLYVECLDYILFLTSSLKAAKVSLWTERNEKSTISTTHSVPRKHARLYMCMLCPT